MLEQNSSFDELQVLYEDNHIIAINKNPSDIVQGDKTGDEPMGEKVKRFIKKKYNKPGDVYLGVIHRLDRPVSGVVLFAKTSKALTRFNLLFKEKDIQKTYWAIVKNKPVKEEDTLIHYLFKNEKQNKSYALKVPRIDAKESELHYKVIDKSDKYFLIEIKPHTGRHHQIRVQLASIGSPIKGDLKYGFDRSNIDASINLHARKIEFIHPIKNETIEITAPTPKEVLWQYFENRAK
jgi:23S rRNA pseudouridine1911/1915/1917 synthase